MSLILGIIVVMMVACGLIVLEDNLNNGQRN
jgi:hypothetical protein